MSRQVHQALAFLLVIFIFGGGIMYGRWQSAAKERVEPIVIEKAGQETDSSPGEERAGEIKVHVAGAVERPGVYEFTEKSRVEDALILAMPLPEADIDQLNLATYLRDEERVYVPYREEIGEGPIGTVQGVGGGKVNINLAGKDELMTLPGIGPTLAQRILDYRHNQGPFRQIEDLKQVSGIGEKKFQELQSLVTH